MSLEEVLQSLCASTKLERDRAETAFKTLCQNISDSDVKLTVQWIADKLDQSSAEGEWERRFGALTTLRILLPLKTGLFEELEGPIRDGLVRCLEDPEFRVRIAAGECLGAMCATGGLYVFSSYVEMVKAGIRSNLERCNDPVQSESAPTTPETEVLRKKLKMEIFHDTAGWKSLETWMSCLRSMVEQMPQNHFQDYEDAEFFPLLFDTLTHTNRFVRETGFQLLGVSVPASRGCVQTVELARQLAAGLSDNWSQVRMSASVATRHFLQCYGVYKPPNSQTPLRIAVEGLDEERREVLDLLLPPMCLNRYYIAEGVRCYSQETWRLATDGQGMQIVARHLSPILNYYMSQAGADNHAVREAACSCLAELSRKMAPDTLRPLLKPVMDALLVCFMDDCWPVRDTACLAVGTFVNRFPDECAEYLPRVIPLIFGNLKDGIPSVRRGAAVSMREVLLGRRGKEGGAELEAQLLKWMQEGLAGVKGQAADSDAFSNVNAERPAEFGVAESRFENQTMYSCGSLAPKMKKGASKGGCHDGTFTRPAQPWEIADSCVHLIRELSQAPELHEALRKLLEPMATAAGHTHYPHHVYLLENVFNSLPVIAKLMGARKFKAFLEPFLHPMAYGVRSDNQLTASAAQDCVLKLSNAVGLGIFRGRVEMFDQSILGALEPFMQPEGMMRRMDIDGPLMTRVN